MIAAIEHRLIPGSADLGILFSILTLPFKLVIFIIKKIVIGIPIMVAKSLVMALLMALLPLIVVAAVIWWVIATKL